MLLIVGVILILIALHFLCWPHGDLAGILGDQLALTEAVSRCSPRTHQEAKDPVELYIYKFWHKLFIA